MRETLSNCPICESNRYSLLIEVKDHFLTGELFNIVTCEACGFKFVNPRPDPTGITGYYQTADYISHDGGKNDLLSRIYKLARWFSVRTKYRIVKRHVKEGKLLDIGCGTGEFLKYCKDKGLQVQGVEPIEKARTYARATNRIPVEASLPALETTNGIFHCVTMWHVLEHVHELNQTMESVKKKLAAGGIFIVAVPNSKSWDAEKYGNFWAAYDVPRHLYHFDEDSVSRLVHKHGFKIITVIPQKLDAYYVAMLSEKYRTGKNTFLKSLAIGWWSNFRATSSGRGHSSQIFVLSVKTT